MDDFTIEADIFFSEGKAINVVTIYKNGVFLTDARHDVTGQVEEWISHPSQTLEKQN